MNIDHIIPSVLKVTASTNLNIQKDLEQNEPEKTLAQILNEEKQIETETEKGG